MLTLQFLYFRDHGISNYVGISLLFNPSGDLGKCKSPDTYLTLKGLTYRCICCILNMECQIFYTLRNNLSSRVPKPTREMINVFVLRVFPFHGPSKERWETKCRSRKRAWRQCCRVDMAHDGSPITGHSWFLHLRGRGSFLLTHTTY